MRRTVRGLRPVCEISKFEMKPTRMKCTNPVSIECSFRQNPQELLRRTAVSRQGGIDFLDGFRLSGDSRFAMKLTPALLLGLSVSFLTPVCPARNIILFIGDGMGFEHVQAGRLYVKGSAGGGLSFELLPYHGRAVTTLPSGAVTDSATAGTALATGYQHPVNSTISTDTDGNPVETILERARNAGWRTGIITTDDIGGATPGAFGAHEPDRNLMADIRADYLVPDFNHGPSLPNALFGGGASAEYAAAATAVGYTVVATASASE